MSRTYLITGSASGIGRATRDRLLADGHVVIGADLADADIECDLSDGAGRARLIAEATELCGGELDGVAASAGIVAGGPPVLAIDYFGAVATLEGLRPLLEKSDRPRAVALCSTASFNPADEAVVDLCLAGDEETALVMPGASAPNVYATAKRALARWIRRTAVRPEWAGKGILLNGLGPGVTATPMMAPLFADAAMTSMIAETNPIAVDGFAAPEDIADLLSYLLTFGGNYLLGQIIYSDGGTDALLRPDVV